MPYIEVKTRQKIGLTIIRKIVAKGCVSGIVTTGTITVQAKEFLEANNIAYAENILEGDITDGLTVER